MSSNPADVAREAGEISDSANALAARARNLATMAAALPATHTPERWRCPVSRCGVEKPVGEAADHVRNVHGDEAFVAWAERYPEHARLLNETVAAVEVRS